MCIIALGLALFVKEAVETRLLLLREIKIEAQQERNQPRKVFAKDHIIRESEYFVGIAQGLLYNQPKTGADSLKRQMSF